MGGWSVGTVGIYTYIKLCLVNTSAKSHIRLTIMNLLHKTIYSNILSNILFILKIKVFLSFVELHKN